MDKSLYTILEELNFERVTKVVLTHVEDFDRLWKEIESSSELKAKHTLFGLLVLLASKDIGFIKKLASSIRSLVSQEKSLLGMIKKK